MIFMRGFTRPPRESHKTIQCHYGARFNSINLINWNFRTVSFGDILSAVGFTFRMIFIRNYSCDIESWNWSFELPFGARLSENAIGDKSVTELLIWNPQTARFLALELIAYREWSLGVLRSVWVVKMAWINTVRALSPQTLPDKVSKATRSSGPELAAPIMIFRDNFFTIQLQNF